MHLQPKGRKETRGLVKGSWELFREREASPPSPLLSEDDAVVQIWDLDFTHRRAHHFHQVFTNRLVKPLRLQV